MEKTVAKPTKTSTVRIMVVDDHPIVRRGLIQTFEQDPAMESCGEASGIHEAMGLIEASRPDVIILDIGLKDGSGLDLIKRVRSQYPEIKLLVNSMHDDWLFAERALHAGAMGYVNKAVAPEKIMEALHTVLDGRLYLSEEAADRLLTRAVKPHDVRDDSPLEKLTDREIEVFAMLGQGKATREISTSLHISVKTVETHKENIKRKLQLKGNTEIIQRAVEWSVMQKLSAMGAPAPASNGESAEGA